MPAGCWPQGRPEPQARGREEIACSCQPRTAGTEPVPGSLPPRRPPGLGPRGAAAKLRSPRAHGLRAPETELLPGSPVSAQESSTGCVPRPRPLGRPRSAQHSVTAQGQRPGRPIRTRRGRLSSRPEPSENGKTSRSPLASPAPRGVLTTPPQGLWQISPKRGIGTQGDPGPTSPHAGPPRGQSHDDDQVVGFCFHTCRTPCALPRPGEQGWEGGPCPRLPPQPGRKMGPWGEAWSEGLPSARVTRPGLRGGLRGRDPWAPSGTGHLAWAQTHWSMMATPPSLYRSSSPRVGANRTISGSSLRSSSTSAKEGR